MNLDKPNTKKVDFSNDHTKVNKQCEWFKSRGVSPVDSALLFGHYSLEVSELEKAVVEVVQMENTHKQEGSGNENPGEQLGDRKLLQAQVL